MKIEKAVRTVGQQLFYEGLIETQHPETGELDKNGALQWALGRMAMDYPGIYHQMMVSGPLMMAERIGDGFLSSTRNRNRRRFEKGNVRTLEEVYESMDSEVVSWPIEGEMGHQYKFVYRCTVIELKDVVKGYQTIIDRNTEPRNRYQLLVDRLEEAGYPDDVPLCDLGIASSSLRAV